MICYKQWHQENPLKFSAEHLTAFSECNKNKVMSLHELMRFTSDIAVEDFNQRGMSREILLENNFMILVSRCSFKFHNRPKENQKITLNTWEEKNEPLQFIRAYEIVDSETKELLVEGLSTWLLVDAATRRLLPIKNFDLREPVTTTFEHQCQKPAKITEPDTLTLLAERTISFSDLDSNGHTNNSRYAAFMMDALPAKYQDLSFTDFKINFSKEAMLGEKLFIFANFDDQTKKIYVFGKTGSNGENLTTSFEAELWY